GRAGHGGARDRARAQAGRPAGPRGHPAHGPVRPGASGVRPGGPAPLGGVGPRPAHRRHHVRLRLPGPGDGAKAGAGRRTGGWGMTWLKNHLRNKFLAGALAAVPVVVVVLGALLVEQYARPLAQQVGLDFPGAVVQRRPPPSTPKRPTPDARKGPM